MCHLVDSGSMHRYLLIVWIIKAISKYLICIFGSRFSVMQFMALCASVWCSGVLSDQGDAKTCRLSWQQGFFDFSFIIMLALLPSYFCLSGPSDWMSPGQPSSDHVGAGTAGEALIRDESA